MKWTVNLDLPVKTVKFSCSNSNLVYSCIFHWSDGPTASFASSANMHHSLIHSSGSSLRRKFLRPVSRSSMSLPDKEHHIYLQIHMRGGSYLQIITWSIAVIMWLGIIQVIIQIKYQSMKLEIIDLLLTTGADIGHDIKLVASLLIEYYVRTV